MRTEAELRILNPRMTDKLPTCATPGSVELDLHTCLDEAVTLQPGDTYLVPTDLAIHLTNSDYAAVLLSHSGLGHKRGIVLGSLVGLIDLDYQDELRVSVWSRGEEAFTIEPMERIAQVIIVPVAQTPFRVVDEFAASGRGEGGLSNTGKS